MKRPFLTRLYSNLSVKAICSFLILISCDFQGHERKQKVKDKYALMEVNMVPQNLPMRDTTYVPIYSQIYNETKETKFSLTATLSVRNTSFKHTIYLTTVDYYDSFGEIAKTFQKNPLKLAPMQSVEYVIEEGDLSGGTGANFIIIWEAESTAVDPIFEGIMLSNHAQQGISFTTKGISISNK
ncbi:MAG: DUF3124 domain-containing protein [Cyclobacteriaceae bacterium]|nr:DUF3124 domain-containing protein [Cyclobacteriaceae bacterium SS2]